MTHDDMIEFKAKLEEFFEHPVVLEVSIYGVGNEALVELAAARASRLIGVPVTRHAVRKEGGDIWWAYIGCPFPNSIGTLVSGSGPVPDGWGAIVAEEA